MPFYFTKTLNQDFDGAMEKVILALEQEGFGILTEIDVSETFRRELGVEFKKYRILGACDFSRAYNALSIENKNCTINRLRDREQLRRGGRRRSHGLS